ncbi:hypothetical protein IC006_0249 [Sulfuracidifex tepidarius]|uniref:Archaeal PaREP1/PaREP8 family protein n=2 Tax=Sulfuracidifex tepidarius TaxID=1294262 RepID=A0A510DZQ8_9CREN|nr:PaREP1 family protein [Sulfuracidifex tepidarius]BBG22965.1 hypothetical protein IC006_0249 [Sulfuracidifex tepidarius]BBG25726.1 hypothetical protein IC007_0231 [Sulfuracidifex tepidarius]
MTESITKPWTDTKRYQMDRFKEALYEADLAERFLNDGLIRNSAGKVYQAVKAYIAGISVNHRDSLSKYYPGKRRISPNKVVDRVDWIIAIMPSSKLREIVSIMGDDELRLVTEIALDLHDFQYNGYDRDAEISRYTGEELVKKDILLIVEFIKSKLST